MARQKTSINKSEVEEIIALKIKDLNDIKSKLTYNNVWNFNKELVKGKQKRSDGELFNLYGYTFWASGYMGEDYYGKSEIDRIKTAENLIIAGESFTIEMQDILIMVDKFHKKPQELSKRILKTFERDRKKAASLQEQNDKLNEELVKSRTSVEILKQGITTMFYSSVESDNSLNNVMSMSRTGDPFVLDELKTMFNQDEGKIGQLLKQHTIRAFSVSNSTVVNIQDKAKARAELKDEGF